MTEMVWPAKLKTLPVWPLMENVCQPLTGWVGAPGSAASSLPVPNPHPLQNKGHEDTYPMGL